MRTFGDKRKKSAPNAFIGREQQLALFRQNLEIGPDSEAFINIFNIYGQGGVGKSTLAKRYEDIAKAKKVATTFIDQEDNKLKTIPEFMAAIAKDLSNQGADFSDFDGRYKIYRQENKELEKNEDYPSWAKAVGSSLAKMGMKAAKTIDGGLVTGHLPEETIAKQSGEWLDYLRKRLTNKDQLQLLHEPLEVLTPLWLNGLNAFAANNNFCIFIDTYETALPILDLWLRKLLNQDYGELTYKILLIIGGRNRLPSNDWSELSEFAQFIPLEEFSNEEAVTYLKNRNITNKETIDTIITLSTCLPVLLATLADEVPTANSDMADPSDTAVKRFLKWIKDPVKSNLALKAALPRYLNKDIIKRLLPKENEANADHLFIWLKERPFVQNRGGQWTYHPIVRDLMLRYQRQLSEEDWELAHKSLYDFYKKRIERMGLTDRKDQFKNERCLAFLLEYCYHQLCAGYNGSLPYAIQEFATILRISGAYRALPWVKTIQEVELIYKEKGWGALMEDGLAQIIVSGEYGEKAALLINKMISSKWIINDSDAAFYFLAQGNVLNKLDRKEEALTSYDKAIELNPQYAKAYSNRGTVLDGLDRKEEALTSYDKAIELNPQYAKAYYNRGTVLDGLDRKEEALTSYDKAIELNPHDATAYYNRGTVLDGLDRKEEALTSYDKAIELNPQYATAYYNRGNVLDDLDRKEEALTSYDKAIELNPHDATAYSNRGTVLDGLDRKEEALTSYDKAIELNPHDATAYYNRGTVLDGLDRKEEALTSYDKAIELNPQYATAYSNRGTVLDGLDRKEEALNSYDKAIELNPQDATAYYNRGTVLDDLDRKEEALNSYDKAIELNPQYAKAYSNRGTVLNKLDRKEEALNSYDKAIELNPQYAKAYSNRGNVLDDLDRKEEALNSYDKAIELNPQDATAYYNRGNVLDDLDRKEEALNSYDKAIELNPQMYQVWGRKAMLQLGQEKIEEAIYCFEKVIGIQSDLVPIQKILGELNFNQKDYPKALQAYQAIIKLEPNDEEALQKIGLIFGMQENFEGAIETLKKVLEQNPQNYDSWNYLAITYRQQQEEEKALPCYQKIVEIKPEFHQAWFNIGWSSLLLQKNEAAEKAFQKTWELQEGKTYYTTPMNLGHAHLLQDNELKAIEWYQNALQRCEDEKQVEQFFQGMEEDYKDLKMQEQGITKEIFAGILQQLQKPV